jgi:hypothetical protein
VRSPWSAQDPLHSQQNSCLTQQQQGVAEAAAAAASGSGQAVTCPSHMQARTRHKQATTDETHSRVTVCECSCAVLSFGHTDASHKMHPSSCTKLSRLPNTPHTPTSTVSTPPPHLHWLQVMCMQPWFFSMGLWHLGQGLVLARIQLRFSLSALFLVIHLRTVPHATWWWQQQQQRGSHAAHHVNDRMPGMTPGKGQQAHNSNIKNICRTPASPHTLTDQPPMHLAPSPQPLSTPSG